MRSLNLDIDFEKKLNELKEKNTIETLMEILNPTPRNLDSNVIISCKKTLTILGHLLLSVCNFDKFLTEISGLISILHSELKSLKGKLNKKLKHSTIKGNAEEIKKFIQQYNSVTPSIDTDLKLIKDNHQVLDNDCNNKINKWVPEVINKKGIEDKIKDILQKMNVDDDDKENLIVIIRYKQICN